jgi:hypothetical protein
MKSLRWAFLPGIFLFCLFLSARPASGGENGEELKSIGFLPVTIQADQGLSYLREGIRDMLASRLAAATGATVVNMAGVKAPGQAHDGPEMQSILASGRKRQADLLVAGNFVSRANSVSLDVIVYRTDNSSPPIRFHADTETAGGMLMLIDQLVLQMAEKLYGLKRPNSPPVAAVGGQDLQGDTSASPTTHPERPFLIPEVESSSPRL